jgi:hypothetical protein
MRGSVGGIMAKDDLISRRAVLAALSSRLSIVDMVGVAEIVESVPAVEAEPVVHAHWVTAYEFDFGIGEERKTGHNCSRCGLYYTKKRDRCPDCGAHMDEKVMVPMYLGKCDETDCEHWRWSGDSYHDRNTECFCLLNGKSVYRHKADEEHIECPLGKMMEEEVEYE